MFSCIVFELSHIDWNALTAIGTILLAIITYCTVRQNKSQLKEMRRQWEIEQSPDLDFALISLPYRMQEESLAIEITNFGRGIADNIKLKLDKDFMNNFPIESVREKACKIEQSEYRVLPGKSQIIQICRFDTNLSNCDTLFGQKVSKKEREQIHQYFENFTFDLECSYNGVHSPFKHTFTAEEKGFVRQSISSGLSEIAEEIEDVKRSIDTLASNVDSLYYPLESRQ